MRSNSLAAKTQWNSWALEESNHFGVIQARFQNPTRVEQHLVYRDTYVLRDDTPQALIVHAGGNKKVLYLDVDHLGSPIAARNQAGRKVWKWESDAFGSTAANEDPDGDGTKTTINLRFPGQYFDAESALHYNWARYYDPKVGRYISADPIGVEGGGNAFAYVGGNPTSYVDPDGLSRVRPSGAAVRPMYPPIGPNATPPTHRHHSGPVFLGFPRNQDLTTLTRPVHEALHRDLKEGLHNPSAA